VAGKKNLILVQLADKKSSVGGGLLSNGQLEGREMGGS